MITMLPFDIILSEILPKLPARSLVRFKCVCKSFNTLISSPKFIDLHLRNSTTNDVNRLLILNTGGRRRIRCMDLDSFSSLNLSFLHYTAEATAHTIGSCNGLVLFKVCTVRSYDLIELILFNPCTGELLYVPGCYPKEHVSLGFGYDSTTQDYKIVKLVIIGTKLTVFVFSLKANSCKQIVNNNASILPYEGLKHGREFGVLIHNHLLHWKFYSCEMKQYIINCFDLKTEQWVKDVPLPDYRIDYVKELGILDGCLCVLTGEKPRVYGDVWVMKEYGIKESWVKILGFSDSIVTESLKHCPLAYRGIEKNEILVVVEENNDNRSKSSINVEFLWYNIRDKTYAIAHQIYNIPQVEYCIYACICHGSLVDIPDGQRIVKEKQH